MAVYRGTYFSQPFTLKDKTTGVPLNLTGWTFKAELREALDDPAPALTLDSASGGFSIIDAVNGRMSFNITAAQSASLELTRYIFDVVRTDPDPGPIWQFGGSLVVKDPVTR